MKFKRSALAIGSAVMMAFAAPAVVLAESTTVQGFLPDALQELINILGPSGICATQYINSRVQFAVFLVLGGIVLVAVAYSIIAGFKYIQSKGDPGQIEEANKSIKAIFMGIAAMIIAIIGITVVFAIFGARRTDAALLQTCINAASSKGCKACQVSLSDPTCNLCESKYEALCNKYTGKTISFESIKAELPADCK